MYILIYVNKYNTTLMKLSLTIIFLHNIALKGKIPLFKMMFVSFCCFTQMEGHTAYVQPCLFPKVLLCMYIYIYTYTSTPQ